MCLYQKHKKTFMLKTRKTVMLQKYDSIIPVHLYGYQVLDGLSWNKVQMRPRAQVWSSSGSLSIFGFSNWDTYYQSQLAILQIFTMTLNGYRVKDYNQSSRSSELEDKSLNDRDSTISTVIYLLNKRNHQISWHI